MTIGKSSSGRKALQAKLHLHSLPPPLPQLKSHVNTACQNTLDSTTIHFTVYLHCNNTLDSTTLYSTVYLHCQNTLDSTTIYSTVYLHCQNILDSTTIYSTVCLHCTTVSQICCYYGHCDVQTESV